VNAVVFDLDDTLLHDDLTISDYSVQVFHRLRDKGITIIAASGRAQLSMKPYVDQLDCVSAYISCNGAEIWDGATHRLVHQELLSVETSVDIALFAENHSCYAQVYDGGNFYFNQYGVYAERYAASARLNGIFVGKLSDYIHEPRNKILLMDSELKISRMFSEAKLLFSGRASVTCSKPFYLEFNPLNATKGKALKSVSALLNLHPKDFVAIGDSLNDLSMLQAAGLAVTVANGWDEIKPYCGFISQSNNEDGPAHFLNEYFLNGEVIP